MDSTRFQKEKTFSPCCLSLKNNRTYSGLGPKEERLFPQFLGVDAEKAVLLFLSRRPFGYYLPIASYGTIFAAKWSSNGGLEAVVSK